MKLRSALPALCAAGLLALAGCGQAKDAGDNGAGGKPLVVARSGDINTLDPHTAAAFQSVQTLGLVYDGLTQVNQKLEILPSLATDWKYDAKGTELTLHLRKGVKFASGAAFTSADVKASLERILDPNLGAIDRTRISSIDEVQTPDPLTVVLKLKYPDGTLPAVFADEADLAMVSAADIKSGAVKSKPNGTGPFKWRKWTQGQSVMLDANPAHWGGAPKVPSLEFRVVGDQSSIVAGMRAKQFDVGVISDPAVAKQVGNPLKLSEIPNLGYWALMMATGKGPLADQRVRQAVSCAIDRKQVIQAAAFGQGEPVGPFGTTPGFERDPFLGLPCADGPDLGVSRDLLAKAGHPNGVTIELMVLLGDDPTAVKIAQNLKSQLAKAGINVKLDNQETNVYVERWLKGDFEASMSPNTNDIDPQMTYPRWFLNKDANLYKTLKFTDPELTRLMTAGAAETDPDKSHAIAEQISKRLVETSPLAWLFSGEGHWALQPDLKGFVPMPTGSLTSLRSVTRG